MAQDLENIEEFTEEDFTPVYYFFLQVKFYSDLQPLLNVGSFVFIYNDSDFGMRTILERIRLPKDWKMKELMPRPVKMDYNDFMYFKIRHPNAVFDFTTGDDNIVIRAEEI